jgi:hypothetical protein
MIHLNPERTAFGRHETFHLRFGWLTKGHQAWFKNPEVFEREDATVELGVGKNMVTAIRYWMLATQMAGQARQGFEPSPLGRRIFDTDGGWDPYLEDDATLWLLHWLLASNPEYATTVFWFFNRFHKPEFTGDELFHALRDFAGEKLDARVSETTLRHDAAVLIRMYQPTAASKSMPLEESLDSPMAMLGLIRPVPETKYHESRPEFRAQLPPAILGFAVAQLFEATGATALPIEQLMHGDGALAAPGAVFRLTEECLVAKLEELMAWSPGLFKLSESAGIHQIFRLSREAADPHEFLNRHYGAKR